MSNPLKSVGKAVGKVFKGVTNAVKKAWKPLAIGAAIYFSGGALGLWATPLTGAAGGAAATGVGASGVPLMSAANAAPAGGLAAVAPKTAATVSGLGGGAAAASTAAASTGAATIGSKLKSAASSMMGFIDKHPTAALIGGNMLASAFTPTPTEEAIKLDKYRRQNSSYFGVPGTAQHGTPGTNIGGIHDLMNQLKPRPGLISGNMV